MAGFVNARVLLRELPAALTDFSGRGFFVTHTMAADNAAGRFPGVLAIMLATAATLHNQGVTQIESAAQAAEALRPVAGQFAFALFALGIIGTGLLAVPVLAGSAARFEELRKTNRRSPEPSCPILS